MDDFKYQEIASYCSQCVKYTYELTKEVMDEITEFTNFPDCVKIHTYNNKWSKHDDGDLYSCTDLKSPSNNYEIGRAGDTIVGFINKSKETQTITFELVPHYKETIVIAPNAIEYPFKGKYKIPLLSLQYTIATLTLDTDNYSDVHIIYSLSQNKYERRCLACTNHTFTVDDKTYLITNGLCRSITPDLHKGYSKDW